MKRAVMVQVQRPFRANEKNAAAASIIGGYNFPGNYARVWGVAISLEGQSFGHGS